MDKVELKVFGKLNLALNVFAKSENENFHQIETLMTSVDVCDELTITKRSGKDITCTCPDRRIRGNTALIAAQNFAAAFATGGVDIAIKKGIPLSGGMGGSGADAAAVLCGMARLFDADKMKLNALARGLGSDVPYLMVGGCMKAAGRGEALSGAITLPATHFVLVQPDFGVSAAEAYAAFDAHEKTEHANIDELIAAIKYGDKESIVRNIKNSLELPVCTLYPALLHLRAEIEKTSPMAVSMTGSGSVFFGLYGTKRQADDAADILSGKFSYVKSVQSTPCGVLAT